MANKMLIDASHSEETRVVVTRGNKVEEFDFESASRRQLRGNIYLAKVTRVEPSLQAAFIEYGGNRHGFLAFSEIHPDYYQIPVADRQALIEAEAKDEPEEEREEERRGRGRRRRGSARRNRGDETVSAPVEGAEAEHDPAAEAADLPAQAEADTLISPEQGESDAAGAVMADTREAPEASQSEHETAPEQGNEAATADTSRPADAISEPAEPAAAAEPEAEIAQAAVAEVPPAVAEAWAPVLPQSDADQAPSHADHPDAPVQAAADDETVEEAHALAEDVQTALDDSDVAPRAEADDTRSRRHEADDEDEDEDELEEHEIVEQVGGDDAYEEANERPRAHRRHYKIQEVIKRRQILLVQVVKEERGNKGAALTTYLSLAGRYSVLMPNTGKGGGISRKITSAEDRKRLKEVVQDLSVPEGMGVILRTAGASRSKPEIKRDFEYLMRLWESVREMTLGSSAPALVYEEGSLIKRAIRDLYNKDIDDVIVSGEEGFEEAQAFMQMIMPGQSRIVKPHREPQPLFAQYGVEGQLDAMFSSHVTLKSGGYLVINPTEALVSIDVNSGRSTREHNIEDTAVRTNLEAAEEIARQLRLRDLAGLIVIDFIDMEENRNNRSVEKKLKECLKNDRARIQVGRISPFGLLEMSRQRIRTGVLESSSIPCQHCAGTGFVRATPSVALQVLRSAEEALLRSASHNLIIRARTEVAFYTLNQKRAHLSEIEERFGVSIAIMPDDTLVGTATYAVDRGDPAVPVERKAPVTGVRIDTVMPVDEPIEIDPTAEYEREAEDESEAGQSAEAEGERGGEAGDDASGKRKRRRRRRRGGRNGETRDASETGVAGEDEEDEDGSAESAETTQDDADRSALAGDEAQPADQTYSQPAAIAELAETIDRIRPAGDDPSKTQSAVGADGAATGQPDGGASPAEHAAPPEPREAATQHDGPAVASEPEAAAEPAPVEPAPEPVAIVLTPPDPSLPKRAGWWSKAKAALGGS
jgi:ribonuclease E